MNGQNLPVAMQQVNGWYAISQLIGIAGLPKSDRGIEKMATRENWPRRKRAGRGGGWEYPLTCLPKETQAALLSQMISTPSGAVTPFPAPAFPGGDVAAGVFMPAATPNVAPRPALRDEDKTETQRAGERARKQVLAALRRLQADSGCSQEAAMTTLLTSARAGKIEPGLDAMLQKARDKRGRKGDGYPSVRSLKRWLKAPDLTPRHHGKDMTVQPWYALAVALRQRPQGSSFKWIEEQLRAQNHAVSYDQVTRFFRDKFSQLDQLRGRYTGSQLRAHKFYQHRTAEGLAPGDEVHADGWNSHFTAPHPVTGEFVTYEVWHFHDVATRYVTPPGIGLTENAEVIAKGLEHCIRELGVPVHLQTDSTKVVKGSERFTKAMHSLEERLGFTWVHPKEVGNSQANGICENFNTSWLDKRSRELATYQNPRQMDNLTFKRVKKLTADMVKAAHAGDEAMRLAKRMEIARMGKGLVFDSYEEARAWINRIHAEYNDRPHRSLKKIADPATGRKRHQTPREALQEHIANGWEKVALTEAELIDAFRPHVVVKVSRETVKPYGGMRYRNADVLGHWNGKQVVVAYDLDDWRQVWVKDMQGALICVAEFVAATGYRAQSAKEHGEEKRAQATIRRLEKKRDAVLARTPGMVIEADPVKTIADFIDFNAVPVRPEPEKTLLDFLPETPAEEETLLSYSDTVMWLYGEEEEKEKPEEEVAAR